MAVTPPLKKWPDNNGACFSLIGGKRQMSPVATQSGRTREPTHSIGRSSKYEQRCAENYTFLTPCVEIMETNL